MNSIAARSQTSEVEIYVAREEAWLQCLAREGARDWLMVLPCKALVKQEFVFVGNITWDILCSGQQGSAPRTGAVYRPTIL